MPHCRSQIDYNHYIPAARTGDPAFRAYKLFNRTSAPIAAATVYIKTAVTA